MCAAFSQAWQSIRRRSSGLVDVCFRLAVAVLGSLLVTGGFDGSPAAAQERAPVREMYVPADDPQSWPPGQWVARPTDEYRQILADLATEAPPPRAHFERVGYTAALDGDSLAQGRFTADVQLRGFEPAYLSLGAPTCALHHLQWSDRPAVWGLSPGGETLLRVPSDSGTLKGEWSLRGREYFGRVEFEATLPPAVISTMEVRLPVSKQLTTGDEVSVQVVADSDPQWRTWVLDLGQLAYVHFTVSEVASETASPQRLAERVTRYSLRPDGLNLQADFQIESSGGATDQLVFETSANMDVTSVSLGNELGLPFQLERDNDGRKAFIVVPLESGVLEGRITVEVRGTVPLHSEGRVTLPPISLKQFPIVASRLHVTVHRPLELLDYHTERCRLVTSTLIRHQTDHLEFEDWSADSRVAVEWDVPPADVVADVIASADLNEAHPISRTLMRLTARSGSTYELRCRIPHGWQVTRVTSEPWHRQPQISSWKTVTGKEEERELRLEFRNSLTTSDPLFVEIWAARTTDQSRATIDVPLVFPRVPTLRDVRLAIRPSTDRTISLPAASAFRPLKSSEFRAPWADVIPDWQAWLDGPISDSPSSDGLVYFSAEKASESETLLVSAAEPAPANTELRIAEEEPAGASEAANAIGSKNERSNRPSSPETLLADVTVDTLVSAASETPCVTIAAYRFVRPISGTVLEFDLPPPAEWIGVRIDGEAAPSSLSDRTARIRLPSGKSTGMVEIEYRAPFTQSQLWGEGQIPLPRSPLSVTSLRWRIRLPEPFRLRPSTSGTSIRQSQTGWRERLLGPLGAASESSAFWPFNRFSGAAKTAAEGDNPNAISSSDRTESRSVPFTAEELRLAVWRQDRSRHLGWVLLVAALVAVFLTRRLPHSRWGMVRAAWIVGVGIMAALVPDSLAIPCGGVFLGSLAGTVLPVRWSLSDGSISRESRSLGSTRTLAGAVSSLVAMAVILGNQAVAFQTDATTPDAATMPPMPAGRSELSNSPSYDALIPMHTDEATLDEATLDEATLDEATLDETPVVYVNPKLLSRWKSQKHPATTRPPYLLREASYAITSDYQGRPRITASFGVVLLEPSPTPRIALPLTDIVIDNDSPCRVNGEVATVIPMRDGEGIAVEVPPVNRGRLPESDGDETQRGELESDALLRIELAFRPRPDRERTSRTFRVTIPRLASSIAEVQSRTPTVEQRPVNGFGRTTIDTETGRVRTELGPVSRLDMDLNDAARDSAAVPLVPEFAVSFIEAHPRQLTIRTKLSYPATNLAGKQSLETLELVLPPDTRVTNVLVPGLVSSLVESHEGAPTRLQVALEKRPRERLDVEIEYRLPTESTGAAVRIPPIPFVENRPSDKTVRHVVGVHARTGFRLPAEAQELAGKGIDPVTPMSYAQSWGGPPATEPEHAFSLTSPQPLNLAIAAIEPIRTAAVRETLTVDRSRFQWEADIDIECLSAPVAAHRLQIDPRLEVTSIRVVQNGADRLVRWSRRDAGELTLLLTDDLIGRQNIQLIGELPLTSNQPIELPEFAIDRTTMTPHELNIRSPVGWTVEVWNAGDHPVRSDTTTEVSAPNEASEIEFDATFDLLGASPPAKIRVADAAATFDFERVTTIQSRADGQLDLRTILKFPEPSSLPSRVQVALPADWTRFGPLSTRPSQAVEPQRDDDSTVYLFDRQQSDAPLKEAEFSVTFPVPRDDSWTIPDVHVQQGSLIRHLLVLSGDVPFEPTGDGRDVTLDGESLTGLVTDDTGSARRRAYASSNGSWRLSRESASRTDDHIERIETAVWKLSHDRFAGVTAAQIAVRKSQDVAIACPPEVEIVRATMDDKPIVLERDESSSLTASIPQENRATQFHTLRLWWMQPRASSSPRSVIALPRFQQIPISTESVVFLGRDDTFSTAGGDWTLLTQWDWTDAAAASGTFALPVSDALKSAGVVPQKVDAAWNSESMLLLENRTAETAGDGDTTVTVWSLPVWVVRALLIGIIAVLAGILAWKTDVCSRISRCTAGQTTRTYAGATFLAALIWTLGPGPLGFALLILTGSLWIVTAWQERRAETSFSMVSDSSY